MTKPRKIVRHPFVVILTLVALTLVCVAGLNAVPAFAQGIINTGAGNNTRGSSVTCEGIRTTRPTRTSLVMTFG